MNNASKRRIVLGIAWSSLFGAVSCDSLISEFEQDPDDVSSTEIVELSRAGGSLPLVADGRSEDTLVAKIPANASVRVVTFTTTRGRLKFAADGKIFVTRAERENNPRDDRLVARAVLVADTIPGTAVVSATVGDFRRYAEVEFVNGH